MNHIGICYQHIKGNIPLQIFFSLCLGGRFPISPYYLKPFYCEGFNQGTKSPNGLASGHRFPHHYMMTVFFVWSGLTWQAKVILDMPTDPLDVPISQKVALSYPNLHTKFYSPRAMRLGMARGDWIEPPLCHWSKKLPVHNRVKPWLMKNTEVKSKTTFYYFCNKLIIKKKNKLINILKK